jgi:hypothetical protein
MAEMPADRVVEQLRNAPLSKVTVAKEVVRLIGEFGGEAGFAWLRDLAKQDLHRDIRIAVLRALWDHLEHPDTWHILTEAAQSPDGQTLSGVVRIPAERLTADSRRRLVDLLAGLASHQDAMIRLMVLSRFAQMPIPDDEGRVIQAALASIAAPSIDERAIAASVIGANATADDAPQIVAAVSRVVGQRRALLDFVIGIAAGSLSNPPRRRRLARTATLVLEELRKDPLTAGLRLRLATGVLGMAGLEQELQRLVEERFPLEAVYHEASEAIHDLGRSTERSLLPALESRLALSDDPHQRLLALTALMAEARDHQRWNDARRVRLQGYRGDPAPLVAMRAQYFFEGDELM